MLIIGRTVAGLGGAGIINGAIMIISGCVPPEKRPGEYYNTSKPCKHQKALKILTGSNRIDWYYSFLYVLGISPFPMIHAHDVLDANSYTVGQLGMVVGPLVGGAFTSYNTWRWCKYLSHIGQLP
jgi:MFS family permease